MNSNNFFASLFIILIISFFGSSTGYGNEIGHMTYTDLLILKSSYPGKALVVVYPNGPSMDPDGSLSGAIPVFANGKFVGNVLPRYNFISIFANPGNLRLDAFGENVDQMNIDVHADGIYIISLDISISVMKKGILAIGMTSSLSSVQFVMSSEHDVNGYIIKRNLITSKRNRVLDDSSDDFVNPYSKPNTIPKPGPDNAVIVVIRNDANSAGFGPGASGNVVFQNVIVNNVLIGALGIRSYLYCLVSPGKSKVRLGKIGKQQTRPVSLTVESGKTYYIVADMSTSSNFFTSTVSANLRTVSTPSIAMQMLRSQSMGFPNNFYSSMVDEVLPSKKIEKTKVVEKKHTETKTINSEKVDKNNKYNKYINQNCVCSRSGLWAKEHPSSFTQDIFELNSSETYKVIEISSSWCKIRSMAGLEGWLNCEMLKLAQ